MYIKMKQVFPEYRLLDIFEAFTRNIRNFYKSSRGEKYAAHYGK